MSLVSQGLGGEVVVAPNLLSHVCHHGQELGGAEDVVGPHHGQELGGAEDIIGPHQGQELGEVKDVGRLDLHINLKAKTMT